jgi:hypothetical protein
VDFTQLLIGGTVAGCALYALASAFNRTGFVLEKLIECGACGAAIVAGVHLMYAAFVPSSLAQLVDQHGHPIPPSSGITVHFREFDLVHLLIAGAATSVFGALGIYRLLKETSRGRAITVKLPLFRVVGLVSGIIGAVAGSIGILASLTDRLSIHWSFWAAIVFVSLGTLVVAASSQGELRDEEGK